jgi:hypothetical protein
LLKEDKMAPMREMIDWWILVLESLRNCRDKDSLIFGLQKVAVGVEEILAKARASQDTSEEKSKMQQESKTACVYYD